jgi:hypothetical protein
MGRDIHSVIVSPEVKDARQEVTRILEPLSENDKVAPWKRPTW